MGAESRLTTTTSESIFPAGAWNGTHIGVVYLEAQSSFSQSDPRGNVWFALLNPDGTRALPVDVALTAEPFNYANGIHDAPQIVWTGTEFGVLWLLRRTEALQQEKHFLMLQRLAPDGTPLAPPVDIYANNPIAYDGIQPRLAWSSAYGGYAVAAHGFNQPSTSVLHFHRVGVDGSAPDPVNKVTLSCSGIGWPPVPNLVAGTDGTWRFVTSCTEVLNAVTFNPDGSLTAPLQSLNGLFAQSAALVETSGGWATAWSGSQLWVNNGMGFGSYFAFKDGTSALTYPYSEVSLGGGASGVVDLTWAFSTATSMPRTLLLQRFLMPANGPPKPIAGIVPIVPTPTMRPLYGSPMLRHHSLVDVGGGKRLAIWSDVRFGAAELYVRPVDMLGCP